MTDNDDLPRAFILGLSSGEHVDEMTEVFQYIHRERPASVEDACVLVHRDVYLRCVEAVQEIMDDEEYGSPIQWEEVDGEQQRDTVSQEDR